MQFEKIIKHYASDEINVIEEKQTFIQFVMCDSHYALDTHDVSEIVEMPLITPYPQRVPGYLGIVNLGGQIIPVLDFTKKYMQGHDAYVRQESHLLLVSDFNEHSPFGLIIERPKRVEIAKKMLTSMTANINNVPVRLLRVSDFQSKETN